MVCGGTISPDIYQSKKYWKIGIFMGNLLHLTRHAISRPSINRRLWKWDCWEARNRLKNHHHCQDVLGFCWRGFLPEKVPCLVLLLFRNVKFILITSDLWKWFSFPFLVLSSATSKTFHFLNITQTIIGEHLWFENNNLYCMPKKYYKQWVILG